MEPPRNWRLIMVLGFSAALLLTSWLEDERASKSPWQVILTTILHVREALNSVHTKDYKMANRVSTDSESRSMNKDRRSLPSEPIAFSKPKLKSGIATMTFDMYSCLPRFICEVHAEPPGVSLTDFENDIIGLFRNFVVLEGPGSPVYKYQFAAHMGQLLTGLQPSPCHELYPSCPMSRIQLLDILTTVNGAKRMIH